MTRSELGSLLSLDEFAHCAIIIACPQGDRPPGVMKSVRQGSLRRQLHYVPFEVWWMGGGWCGSCAVGGKVGRFSEAHCVDNSNYTDQG